MLSVKLAVNGKLGFPEPVLGFSAKTCTDATVGPFEQLPVTTGGGSLFSIVVPDPPGPHPAKTPIAVIKKLKLHIVKK